MEGISKPLIYGAPNQTNLNMSRLIVQLSLSNPLKPGAKYRKKYVGGAAPAGDTPTTSEWLTGLLPT